MLSISDGARSIADKAEKVFVVGPPRSGTTWLQSLIASHAKVATTKESHLYSAYLGPWNKRFQFEKNRKHPDIGLFALFSEAEMQEFYRVIAYTVLSRIHAKNPAASVILEKTPNHALNAKQILATFPDAYFVCVIRDPRAVAASMIAASKSWGRDWAPAGVHDAVEEWLKYMNAIRSIQGVTDRAILVKFENLRANGVPELQRVFSTIGLSVSDADCRSIIDSQSLEKKKNDHSAPKGFFRDGKSNNWQRELSRSEIRAIEYCAHEVMLEYGYEPSIKCWQIPPLRYVVRRCLSKIETLSRKMQDRL